MNSEAISSDIFVWDSQFETGIPELDRQHKYLVDLINSLSRILTAGNDPEFLAQSLLRVFDELSDYVGFHFKYEEGLMQSFFCIDEHESAHRQTHAAFVKQLAKLRIATNHNPVKAAGEMLAFLSKWLMTHIVTTDMRFAKKLLAIQSGLSEQDAQRHANDFMGNAGNVLIHGMNRLYDNLVARIQDLLEAKRDLHREIEARKAIELELKKLSRAVEYSPVSILVTDANGCFEYVNPKFTHLTGYALSELKGKTPRALKSGKMPPDVYGTLWATLSSGHEWHGEFRNRKKNGELYWDYTAISPILDETGRISHYVAIQEDITEDKLAAEHLRQQKQFSDDIINSLPGIFYMLDEEGGFVRINPQFSAVTGFPERELMQMNALDLFDGYQRAVIAERILEVFEKGESSAEAELVVRSGRKIPYFFTGHRTFIDGKSYLVGVGTDISERRKLEAELTYQARMDMLTGLPNRRHFLELATLELARAARYGNLLSILMVDLDEFKAINDAYGHQTGDRTLMKFAEVCRHTIRSIDIPGRIGGEEFAILLPETEEGEAMEVAERLRRGLAGAEIEAENGKTFRFTASIGVATLSESVDDIDKLLAASDKALYAAKSAGRNRSINFRP